MISKKEKLCPGAPMKRITNSNRSAGTGLISYKPSCSINENQSWPRKIIHIDMDAFFAAVEQRDNPKLIGKPVVVGGDPFGRGVVSTASYEARKFGIHSAMPAAQARRLCPQAIFVKPHFEKYHEVSVRVMSILHQHTDLVESISLDEAYLDVTEHKFGIHDPEVIALLIKQNILAVTKLTASAGVAPNLFLAKVASDFNKPDGLTVIRPDQITDFLENLPVRKIPGVGPKTEARLLALGIKTCGELAGVSASFLVEKFGKTGRWLHQTAQGIDEREVEPYTESKQYSTEETFEKNITTLPPLRAKLEEYAEHIYCGLKEEGRMGRTVVVKVKYHDFELITRSFTLDHEPKNWREIYQIARELLEKKTLAGKKPVRLLGLGLGSLHEIGKREKVAQRDLFDQSELLTEMKGI